MFETKLENAILKVVREFRVVPERLLIEFFADWGRPRVIATIADLKGRQRLFNQPEQKLSTERTLHGPISTWDNYCAAFSVLSKNRSGEIVLFDVIDNPEELFFTTVEGNSYDVAVFDTHSWSIKYNRVKAAREGRLLPGGVDNVTHVAVVWDESVIEHIYDLGFSYYAILDPWGTAALFESSTSSEVAEVDRGDEEEAVDYYDEKYSRDSLGVDKQTGYYG